jgi:hypothetical protein
MKASAKRSASAFAVVTLIAQIGSVAHFAFVKHVECADHGEMIDVAPDADELRPPAVTDGSSDAVRADRAKAHGHEHCAVAAFRRTRAETRSTESSSSPVAIDRARRAAPTEREPLPSIAILDFAPKGSPPAA